jgi:hypothetical protein
MNEIEISRYITETFEGVDTVEAPGAIFFFCNPDPNVPPEHMFPFVTLVTCDNFDAFSNLERPGVYRLNIGVSKETYRSMFGKHFPSGEQSDGTDEGGYDFTALDQVMPHPVYGGMYWVCVLNASDQTFESAVKPLLAEAHEISYGKQARRSARKSRETRA